MQLNNTARDVYTAVLETYRSWREDRTIRLGAGLAYYTLFTIVPLLALTAALADWLFGTMAVQDYLSDRLAQVGLTTPEPTAANVASELKNNSAQSSLGLIGLGALLFTSSLVFVALTDAFNVIWDVPVTSGWWQTVRRRLVAFLMVLASGAVIIATFAISAVSGAAQALIPGDITIIEEAASLLSLAASGLALAFALACLYRYVGPARVKWVVAVVGGMVAAALMWVGTQLVGWYLTSYGGASLPGAFGAVLAILVWLYYEAQIVLAGCQATKVMTTRREGPGIPEHDRLGDVV